MKKCKILLTFFFLLVFSAGALAQNNFEGKVVMNIQSDGENTDLNYLIKGDNIRIEVPQEKNVAVIFDNGAKKMLLIMPDQKMYMEMPMDMAMKYSGEIGQDKKNNKVGDNPDFKMTGETKTINGYDCEKWTYSNNDGDEMVAWMTKDLGNFMMMTNPMMGSNVPEWQKKLSGAGYFPMQVVYKGTGGEENATMTVKSVDKKKLDASLFSAPSGFKKMEMPMMNSNK